METTAQAGCRVGAVIIGRNEGERLRRCLDSAKQLSGCIVYVDSGSNDGSVALSRSRAIEVVCLDRSLPFTAARARNAGFNRLMQMHAHLEYVFFVDGDCEIQDGWLTAATAFLDAHPAVAAVCGRRRERHPHRSLYNRLCDLEWDTPVGETKACGGDVMMRASALLQVRLYRAELICGEEPELCVRLRQAGWRIWRLDHEMTLHDAALHRFHQWWRRMLRGGYAFAQGASLHGALPERHWVTESRRAWFWGLSLPFAALVTIGLLGWPGMLLLLMYPLQIIRIALRGRYSTRDNWLYATAAVVAKLPEAAGQIKFLWHSWRHTGATLIEYK